MPDSRTGRRFRPAAWLLIAGALIPTPGRAEAQSPRPGRPPNPSADLSTPRVGNLAPAGDAAPSPQPFAIPKDRAEWDVRRPAIEDRLGGSFRARHPEVMKYTARVAPAERLEALPGVIVEPIHLNPSQSTNPEYDGLYLRRDRPGRPPRSRWSSCSSTRARPARWRPRPGGTAAPRRRP